MILDPMEVEVTMKYISLKYISLSPEFCSGDTMKDLYPRLVEAINTYGQPFTPRSLNCKEIRPYSFVLYKPLDSIYGGDDRRLSLRFFTVETLGYLAGLRSKWYMDLMCKVQPKYSQFRDTDGGLAGAYGPALKDSLVDIVDILRSDRSSRQCVASIWRPGVSTMIGNNTPCTCSLQFMTTKQPRSDNLYLSLSVYMRSNDVNWGVAYDIPAFCVIQSAVADACQLPIGTYHHTAGSFHAYEDATDNGMPIFIDPGKAKFADFKIPSVDFSFLAPVDSPLAMRWFIEGSKMFLNMMYDQVITKDGTIKSFVEYMNAIGVRNFVQTIGYSAFTEASVFTTTNDSMVTYWQFWLDCLSFKWSSLYDGED